jgi:hypothetical protein
MVTVLTLTIFNLIWNIVAIAPDTPWMYQAAAYSGASTDDSYSYSYAFILSLSKAFLYLAQTYSGSYANLCEDDDVIPSRESTTITHNDDGGCEKVGTYEGTLQKYFKGADDDETENLVTRAEAAEAFLALSIVVTVAAIAYTSFAIFNMKRIKVIELGIASSFVLISFCVIITTAVWEETVKKMYDDDFNFDDDWDDDDDNDFWNNDDDDDDDDDYTFDDDRWNNDDDYDYSGSSGVGFTVTCSTGCGFSFFTAIWELFIAILWLVWAGTCNKDTIDGKKRQLGRAKPGLGGKQRLWQQQALKSFKI